MEGGRQQVLGYGSVCWKRCCGGGQDPSVSGGCVGGSDGDSVSGCE